LSERLPPAGLAGGEHSDRMTRAPCKLGVSVSRAMEAALKAHHFWDAY
jgi:hypothetical protein